MRATRRRRYIYASFKYACQHVLRLQHQSSSDSLLLSLLMSPSTPLIIPRGSFLGACDEEASPLRLFRPVRKVRGKLLSHTGIALAQSHVGHSSAVPSGGFWDKWQICRAPDKTASRTASLVDSASTSSILAVSFWLIFSVLGACQQMRNDAETCRDMCALWQHVPSTQWQARTESSKLSWVPCASHVPQRLITTGRRGLSSTSEVIMSSSFSNTSRPSETLPTT